MVIFFTSFQNAASVTLKKIRLKDVSVKFGPVSASALAFFDARAVAPQII